MKGIPYKIIWDKIKIPIVLLIGALVFGVAGYKVIYPDMPFEKILFMTGITLSTVGYGDVLDVQSRSVAIYFTMLLMLMGMGVVLYAISNVTAFIIEGNLRHIFRTESIKQKAKKMKDHYVICGVGKTGIHVVTEMIEINQDYIVVEQDPESIKEVLEIDPKAIIIEEDATDDLVFEKVNLASAKGLIASLSNDKDNLYITLSAKMYNPKIEVVARAFELKMFEKLKKAGADYVVSPNYIGGMRIASEILRPHVVTFLDRMLRGKDKSIRVEESKIPSSNYFVGRTIEETSFFDEAGVNILAYSEDGKTFTYNPSQHYRFKGSEVILYICDNHQREKISKFLSKHS